MYLQCLTNINDLYSFFRWFNNNVEDTLVSETQVKANQFASFQDTFFTFMGYNGQRVRVCRLREQRNAARRGIGGE